MRRVSRPSSTTPTRSSRRSASSSAMTRTRSACSARRSRRPGRARALSARDVPPDRPGNRAARVTQYARNEANNVRIGGDSTVFAPNYGSPFVRDLDSGRRYGTIEDFRNFVKLAYLSPHLHPQRRDGVRAGRRAGQQAPPRHGLFAHPLQRQAVHGLGDGTGAGARHPWRWRASRSGPTTSRPTR